MRLSMCMSNYTYLLASFQGLMEDWVGVWEQDFLYVMFSFRRYTIFKDHISLEDCILSCYLFSGQCSLLATLSLSLSLCVSKNSLGMRILNARHSATRERYMYTPSEWMLWDGENFLIKWIIIIRLIRVWGLGNEARFYGGFPGSSPGHHCYTCRMQDCQCG